MEELQPQDLEDLLQELEEEDGAQESLPQEVEELLHVLQAGSEHLDRREAAERLGNVGASSPRIVRALSAAKTSDPCATVARAAAKSLRAPVHQAYMQELREEQENAGLRVEESSPPTSDEAAQHLEQAFALEDESEYEKALGECDTAIRLDPTLADAHNLRGVILEELGRNGEAIQAYREALRLDPGYAAAHENLRAAEAELDEYRIGPRARRSRCRRMMEDLRRCPNSASFRCQECGDALCRTHAMLFHPPDAGSGQDENSGVYCAFHYRTVVERANLQAVGAELEVLFEAEDQRSHHTWQAAGVDLDLEAGELTIHGHPYGEPEISIPVSGIASCEVVEREDITRNLARTLEGGGCGGSGDWADLLVIPLLLLTYAFLEVVDRTLARSTKVPVLKLTQSPRDDSSQGWVIHMRSKKRGRRGQVNTLEMAGRVVAFLRQTGWRGTIPAELSASVAPEAVPGGAVAEPAEAKEPADSIASLQRTSDTRRSHVTALLVSVLLSLPVICCASSLWILGGVAAGNYQVLYDLGDWLFMLGYPLTMIVIKFPDYAGRYLTPKDDLWAIPLVSLLFVVQWVIWGQLIVAGIRRLRARHD